MHSIMTQYYKVDQDGDSKKLDQIDKDIDAFHDKYPEMQITGKSLGASARTRDNNAEDADGGVRYNRNLRGRLLAEQPKSVYR